MGAKWNGLPPGKFLPLTTAEFEILLALVDEQRHGYAIMQDVCDRTAGQVRLLPGTLYRAITRMVDSGLIEIADERPDPELDDERRRYYKLAALGRRVLEAEVTRLSDQVNAARAKKLLRIPKRA
jgi:DNA-binding PadR family transcriptional regulator